MLQEHLSVDPLGWVTGTPARSPSAGIPSRAIGLPGIMFATLGVSSGGCLGPNSYHVLLKLQTHTRIKSSLHFYRTSGLLPRINLFLSHLVTPTTRTLLPYRQYCSTLLNIIKILLITDKQITTMALLPVSQSQGTDLNYFTSWYLFPSVVDKLEMS